MLSMSYGNYRTGMLLCTINKCCWVTVTDCLATTQTRRAEPPLAKDRLELGWQNLGPRLADLHCNNYSAVNYSVCSYVSMETVT